MDPYETTPHAREQQLAGWDPFGVTRNRGHHCRSLSGNDGPTTTPPRASARGVDTYPGLDDDDAMPSLSSAPVFEEARNCGSSQTQELLHDGRQRVYRYPLTRGSRTRGLWVRAWVRRRYGHG